MKKKLLVYIALFSSVYCNEKTQTVEKIDEIFIKTSIPDKVTPSGWTIQYFTTSHSNNLYLKWFNGNLSGLYIDSGVLKLRKDFIPGYVGENKNNIFLQHRCASDCEGILVLSKKNMIAQDYTHVVSFSIETDKIVFVNSESYKDELTFKVNLSDLTTFSDTTIIFKNLALGSFKVGYVDSIKFEMDKTIISADLIDKKDYYRTKYIRETKVIEHQK